MLTSSGRSDACAGCRVGRSGQCFPHPNRAKDEAYSDEHF